MSKSLIYLYSVDDLEAIIQHNRRTTPSCCGSSRTYCPARKWAIYGLATTQGAVGAIREYRDSAEMLRAEMTEKAITLIQNRRMQKVIHSSRIN